MSKVEVKVQFETITPLWTGDAWMENNEIRPSSLIGSLRFWFEVICYFGGVCSEKDFDEKKGRFEKDIKNDEIKERLLKHGTDFNGQIAALKELKVPIPAIIFGTTGWGSLIEIKAINNQNNQNSTNNYPFPINRVEFEELKYKKDNKEIKPAWYFKKGFWGNFEVVFRVPAEIKETIFFPLLNFMDKYGYWGGGWNIGYGRLRINRVEIIEKEVNNVKEVSDWRKDEFDFSGFGKENVYLGENDSKENGLINLATTKNALARKDLKIKYWKYDKCNSDVKEVLKNLIVEKSNLRRSLNDQKERHYIFGKTGNIQGEDLSQGSKILPYINRLDNNSYECGLLSIAGILNLY